MPYASATIVTYGIIINQTKSKLNFFMVLFFIHMKFIQKLSENGSLVQVVQLKLMKKTMQNFGITAISQFKD